jgi:hypothetical protein
MTNVQPGTVPDPSWLWRLISLVRDEPMYESFVIRWRITDGDWRSLMSTLPPGAITLGRMRLELYGVPVDLVPDRRGQWPELVLACDRRNAS